MPGGRVSSVRGFPPQGGRRVVALPLPRAGLLGSGCAAVYVSVRQAVCDSNQRSVTLFRRHTTNELAGQIRRLLHDQIRAGLEARGTHGVASGLIAMAQ